MVSASKDGVEVVIVDGADARRCSLQSATPLRRWNTCVRRVRVIKRRRSFEAVCTNLSASGL